MSSIGLTFLILLLGLFLNCIGYIIIKDEILTELKNIELKESVFYKMIMTLGFLVPGMILIMSAIGWIYVEFWY